MGESREESVSIRQLTDQPPTPLGIAQAFSCRPELDPLSAGTVHEVERQHCGLAQPHTRCARESRC